MRKFTLILLCLASLTGHAAPLQIDNLDDGWSSHNVIPGTPEAVFAGNAEMILNFHEAGDNTLASIFVRSAKLPKNVKLAENPMTWRRVLLARPGNKKLKILSERTFNQNGQWRYILEYKADTGTSLTSIAMVMVRGGKMHVFLFEEPAPLYIRLVSSVRQMFKKVQLS